MKRLLALLLSLGLLGMIATPVAAQRPTSDGLLTSIPIEQTIGDIHFVGEFTAESVEVVNGVLQVTGTLTGTATNTVTGLVEEVSQTVTATLTGDGSQGRCDILFLDIGPIFLDLLGLQIDLSQIVLDIDAVPGPGNLLGNLLCAVVGLLDGPNLIGNALNRLVGIINDLLG